MVNIPVFAQSISDVGYLSIPDFVLQRVTPVKTSNNSDLMNETNQNKELPKLRPVYLPEPKNPPHTRAVIEIPKTKKSEIAINIPKLPKQETKLKIDKEAVENKQLTKENQKISEKKEIKTQSETTDKIKLSQDNQSIEKTITNLEKEKTTEKNEPDKANTDVSSDEFVNNINKIIDEKEQIPPQNIDAKNIKTKNEGNDFLRAFFSLSVVLLLIFVFAWIYARVKGINPTAILTGKFSEKDLNRFNVLSTSTLGQGKDIHLVEINGKQLVIGSTASNINLLTEINQEEIEKLKEHKNNSANEASEENIESSKYTEAEDAENVDVLPEIELPDEENFYYESLENEEFEEFMDSQYYPFKYSNLYKEYLDKKG